MTGALWGVRSHPDLDAYTLRCVVEVTELLIRRYPAMTPTQIPRALYRWSRSHEQARPRDLVNERAEWARDANEVHYRASLVRAVGKGWPGVIERIGLNVWNVMRGKVPWYQWNVADV